MLPKITNNLSPCFTLQVRLQSIFNTEFMTKNKYPKFQYSSPQKKPQIIKLPTNSSQGYGGTQKSPGLLLWPENRHAETGTARG